MAEHTAERSVHKTLAAGTVDLVKLTGFYRQVEIINRDGAAAIYYKVEGSAPSVGGDNTGVLPAVIGSAIEPIRRDKDGTLHVQLISSGTPTYSVIGISEDPDDDH